jgi:hypothetical protein
MISRVGFQGLVLDDHPAQLRAVAVGHLMIEERRVKRPASTACLSHQ